MTVMTQIFCLNSFQVNVWGDGKGQGNSGYQKNICKMME